MIRATRNGKGRKRLKASRAGTAGGSSIVASMVRGCWLPQVSVAAISLQATWREDQAGIGNAAMRNIRESKESLSRARKVSSEMFLGRCLCLHLHERGLLWLMHGSPRHCG